MLTLSISEGCVCVWMSLCVSLYLVGYSLYISVLLADYVAVVEYQPKIRTDNIRLRQRRFHTEPW